MTFLFYCPKVDLIKPDKTLLKSQPYSNPNLKNIVTLIIINYHGLQKYNNTYHC